VKKAGVDDNVPNVDNNVEKTKSKITPVKKAGTSIGLVHPVAVDNDLDNKVEKQIEKETGEDFDFGASMVIAALLVIPVLVMVAITIVMRLRKRGKSLLKQHLLYRMLKVTITQKNSIWNTLVTPTNNDLAKHHS